MFLYASWRVARLSNLNNWTDQVLKAIDRLNLNCIIKVSFSPLCALWAEISQFTFKKHHRYYYDKLDPLNFFAHRYEYEMNNLSPYKIRQLLGQYFSAPIKRDAFEFLTALCTKYDVKNLIQHQITSTYRCKSCGNTKVTTESNFIFSISISILNKKSYHPNDLLNTFSHWCQLTKTYCGKNNILFKNKLTLAKEIVIIRLTKVFITR